MNKISHFEVKVQKLICKHYCIIWKQGVNVCHNKTSNAHKNSAAHIQEKKSSYTAMPTARQKTLSTSWNVHRSDANCKPDLPLSRHLRSTGHHDSFGKLKVTIIDHNPKWDDKSRQERESFWIRKLKTLSPNGINEKK